MTSKLKKSLIQKLDAQPSSDFDTQFFKKLHKEQARPKAFSTWITWVISGCATASVLFIAISNYNSAPHHAFNHKEYIDSMLELQNTANDNISDDSALDLTTVYSDEI